MSARRIHLLWALLIAATLLSGALAESSGGALPGGLSAVVLALAGLKGALIVLDFMELREAPALWRWLLLGWLALVLGLILVWRLLG